MIKIGGAEGNCTPVRDYFQKASTSLVSIDFQIAGQIETKIRQF